MRTSLLFTPGQLHTALAYQSLVFAWPFGDPFVYLCCFRSLHDFCIASGNIAIAYIAHDSVVEEGGLSAKSA